MRSGFLEILSFYSKKHRKLLYVLQHSKLFWAVKLAAPFNILITCEKTPFFDRKVKRHIVVCMWLSRHSEAINLTRDSAHGANREDALSNRCDQLARAA